MQTWVDRGYKNVRRYDAFRRAGVGCANVVHYDQASPTVLEKSFIQLRRVKLDVDPMTIVRPLKAITRTTLAHEVRGFWYFPTLLQLIVELI